MSVNVVGGGGMRISCGRKVDVIGARVLGNGS